MKRNIFNRRSIILILAIIVLSVAGAIGLRIALATWSGPSANPPASNVDAPINVGSVDQSKAGGIDAAALYLDGYSAEINIEPTSGALVFDAANDGDWDLQVYNGSVRVGSGENFYILNLPSCSGKLYTNTSGQVLCGTDSVGGGENLSATLALGNSAGSYDIDMNNNDITGVYKISVTTIDPVYNIDGAKYATYMAAMTGVKEETTGNVNLKCQKDSCFKIIDFDEVEKGSDLWLFYQATDIGDDWENLVVLLTPESRQDVWYEVNSSQHQLLIYGEKEGRVSYRLTAPRFDHQKWPNVNLDERVEGMKVEVKHK